MSEITNGDESLSSTTVDLDDTVEVKKVIRPDLVEINDAFDDLEINPVLKSIAETNELAITWQELQKILDSLVKKVLDCINYTGYSLTSYLAFSNMKLWRIRSMMKTPKKMQRIWLPRLATASMITPSKLIACQGSDTWLIVLVLAARSPFNDYASLSLSQKSITKCTSNTCVQWKRYYSQDAVITQFTPLTPLLFRSY